MPDDVKNTQISLEPDTHCRLSVYKAKGRHRTLTEAVAALLDASGVAPVRPQSATAVASVGGPQ